MITCRKIYKVIMVCEGMDMDYKFRKEGGKYFIDMSLGDRDLGTIEKDSLAGVLNEGIAHCWADMGEVFKPEFRTDNFSDEEVEFVRRIADVYQQLNVMNDALGRIKVGGHLY